MRAISVFLLRRSPWRGGWALVLLWFAPPGFAWSQAETATTHPSLPAEAPGAPGSPVSASGEVLTVEQAVERALQQNRQVQNGSRQVSAGQQQLAAARTERLPKFGVGFLGRYGLSDRSGSEFQTLPSVGLLPNFTTTDRASGVFAAGIAQPLFGLRKINLNAQLQETAVASAREELRLRQHDVRSSVKQVYYELVEIESALGANEESVRYYRELEHTVADRVVQQTALQADLLEVQARRAAQEHESVLLGNRYAAAHEQLNYLMGRDVGIPFRITSVAEVVPPSTDPAALQALALQRRPEIRQSTLAVHEAQLQEKIARAELIPTLSLGIQYFHLTQNVPFNDDVSAGLLFTWEPFDWGRRRDQVRAQSHVVHERQTSLDDSRAQVLMDVNKQTRNLRAARDQLGVTRAALEAARERVRLALDRYGQKAVLYSDVLSAQSALAEASTRNQEALSAYLTAVANLSRAIGENEGP
jgi:outer membrane protein